MEKQIIACKMCGVKLRVPKGEGLVDVTCPNCKTVFRFDSKTRITTETKTPWGILYTEDYVKTKKKRKLKIQSEWPRPDKASWFFGKTNIRQLEGVKQALSAARECKRLLQELGEKTILLAKTPAAKAVVDIKPVPDGTLYTIPYVNMNLKLQGLPDEHLMQTGCIGVKIHLLYDEKEEYYRDPDVVNLVESTAGLFRDTPADWAKCFAPYVDADANEDYRKTICRILTRYSKDKNVQDSEGFYNFRIYLPDGLFTETTPNGENAVSRENLDKFIKMI